ncbi:MAG TPA: EutN/CcmL family microcompartment protein [Rubricoccaceae bacterium]|nr:EutN/CcmL family microcompartment protein [Rubricoccaceae bacterium]
MHLCRVTGTVVSTQKSARLRPTKLLLVRRLGLDGVVLPAAAEEVALDPGLDAGVGDAVLVAKEGAVVAQLFDRGQPEGTPPTPANVVIVAVVDTWVTDGG